MFFKISALLLLSFSIKLNASSVDTKIPYFFKATYDSYYEGEHVGYIKREFKKNDSNYTLKSTSDIKGLYGFIPVEDKRVEVSHFNIVKNGIYKPLHYRMDRSGTWLDFVMDITFNYDENKILFKYKDKSVKKDIIGEVLDNSLFQLKMHQEIKNGNRNEIKYDLAYKTGFRNFHFKYIGKEIININNNEIKTLKFMQIRKNKKGNNKATYSWFDPNNDFVMVKFLYINASGKEEARFELKEYKKTI